MFSWFRLKDRQGLQEGFKERRRYLRLEADIPVHYFIIPKGKEEEIEEFYCQRAEARNIGGGGLMVEIPILSDELLLTTHLIKIKFSLPGDQKPIEAIAKMVCVDRSECGEGFYLRLAFIKISDEDRQKLISYVKTKK
ncbi:MAG TPA: hypothetical protein ENG55_02640 [Candidatus Omnitrophica bacterium]|nr:hypothetical protein [Candidatus Omnitrophota bacterium]